jgi:hypothetical protein
MIRGRTSGSVSYNTHADIGNGWFNECTLPTNVGLFRTGSGVLPATPPSSLTMEATIGHSGYCTTRHHAGFDDPALVSVPDSGPTLTLLCCALVALSAFARNSCNPTR